MTENNQKLPTGLIATFIGALLIIIAAFNSIYTVDAGERAVVLRFGEVKTTSDEGIHFKIPFVDMIKRMSIRTQIAMLQNASSASKDLQMVTTDVKVPYHFEETRISDIYSKQGFDGFAERIIIPNIQETVKQICARFSAEELITKREEARIQIFEALKINLAKYGCFIEGVQITNFNFSEQFNNAIEAKMTAEQTALKAKNDLERVKMEAQQKIALADAQAKANIAIAEAEARSIKLQTEVINAQGGDKYILLKAIERWDGKMPAQLFLDSKAVPMISLPNTK